MAISQTTIFARARTIATQMGADPNQSISTDALAGLKALLPHVIRSTYRRKAASVKDRHDIVTKHTVSIVASVGAVPDTVMREFLPQADFQDSLSTKCIAWMPYITDYDSGTTYSQLGYVGIVGDNFQYRAPAPNQSFTGSLYVTVPTMPTITSNWSTELDIDDDVADDIVFNLAKAIRNELEIIA